MRLAVPAGLTLQQEQMVLGTMLGDGNMTRHGRHALYASNHGWPQAEYNWIKYLILSAFVGTPPRKQKNSGYGSFLSRFRTVSAPAFASSYALTCPNGVKRVNEAWLRRIEQVGLWQAVAWWVMDDGTLHRRKNSTSAAIRLSTEGFSEPEVRLLAGWLRSHGVDCRPARVSRKSTNRAYWTILCSAAGTIELARRIAPHVYPSMRYKVDLPQRLMTATCDFCGVSFNLTGPVSRSPICTTGRCCGRRECRLRRHREASRRSMTPERQLAKNRRQVESYHADLDGSRARMAAYQRGYRAANREKVLEYRRAWRAARKAAQPPPAPTCARCQTPFTTTSPQPGKVRYCPTCRPLVTRETKQRSASSRTRS